MYLASYEVKIKKGNSWEEVKRDGKTYSNLGDCLTFLANNYNRLFGNIFESENPEVENPNEKDLFFFWSVSNADNSYAGVTELTSQSFLEKILKIDLEEFRK